MTKEVQGHMSVWVARDTEQLTHGRGPTCTWQNENVRLTVYVGNEGHQEELDDDEGGDEDEGGVDDGLEDEGDEVGGDVE